MEEEPNAPEPKTQADAGQEPSPFDPDPDLVTYLERDRPNDASERFRETVDRLEGGTANEAPKD